MKLTRARVQEIALKMKGMPAAPATEACVTKQEAVRMLAGEIASLQRRGYTLEMITDGLRGDGLELTTPTLKSYGLAKAGGLGEIARCSGRGMIPRDGWCTVQSERGKPLARWRLPPEGTNR